jgi:hypothetical protein
MTFKTEVTDDYGETIPEANVRAVITGPDGSTKNIKMERDLETGYYQTPFTFQKQGNYSLRVVASKYGFVSGQEENRFNVFLPQEEPFAFGESQVLLLVLLIGVIVVALALWKALI